MATLTIRDTGRIQCKKNHPVFLTRHTLVIHSYSLELNSVPDQRPYRG